jgi:hypothetical protein
MGSVISAVSYAVLKETTPLPEILGVIFLGESGNLQDFDGEGDLSNKLGNAMSYKQFYHNP